MKRVHLQVFTHLQDAAFGHRTKRCALFFFQLGKHCAAGTRHSTLQTLALKESQRFFNLWAQGLCYGLQIVAAKLVMTAFVCCKAHDCNRFCVALEQWVAKNLPCL